MIKIKRIHHVQLCIGIGEEEKAREFYTKVLHLKEIEKPDSLKVNGGLWYEIGNIELHLGTEDMTNYKSKRHPAFEVTDIQTTKQYLIKNKVKIKEEIPIPNIERFSFFDPFGNRIEFMQWVN